MKIIGLTGGIASGKSTVSGILRGLGAHIIDADAIAREIVVPGSEALREIVEAFGTRMLDEDGALKRRELALVVFNDREALQRLNAITHPRIIEALRERIRQAPADCGAVILDAALLIELNLGDMVDTSWLVCIDPETQISRLMERESMSRADAVKIIGTQLPQAEKKKAADVCIDNNGSLEELKEIIIRLWNQQVKHE